MAQSDMALLLLTSANIKKGRW